MHVITKKHLLSGFFRKYEKNASEFLDRMHVSLILLWTNDIVVAVIIPSIVLM